MNLAERLNFQGGLFGTRLFSVGDTPITPEKIIVFVIMLFATVIVSRLAQRTVVHAFGLRGIKAEGRVSAARRLLHYVILAAGLMLAFETIGISLGALFAAGAVFAIGLGFAMQNIVQNFVSGLILLAERTIKPGDVLQVDGRFVKVREMGIRTTIARTLDEEEIIVPNASIVQSTVTNYTLQDSLYRLRCGVGVTYGSDMALVRQTLEAAAQRIEWRVKSQDPVVVLTDFADSSVVWEVSVWIDDPWSMRRAKSDLNERIWWALKEAGITIAFPQVDVHFDTVVHDSLRALGRAS
jgi:potassium efflux system protein